MSVDQTVADRQRGAEFGRAWAGEAEPSQLRGIQAFREAFDGHSSLTFEDMFTMSDEDRETVQAGHPYMVVPAATDPEITSHNDAAEFWERIGLDEEDRSNNLFLLGFVEGALDAWGEVEDPS